MLPFAIFAALCAVRLAAGSAKSKTPATSPEKVPTHEHDLEQGSADSAVSQPGHNGGGEPRPLPADGNRAERLIEVVGTRDRKSGKFVKKSAA